MTTIIECELSEEESIARVRVFPSAGEGLPAHVGVWDGFQWAYLPVESVTVHDGPEGALASIVVSCDLGSEGEAPVSDPSIAREVAVSQGASGSSSIKCEQCGHFAGNLWSDLEAKKEPEPGSLLNDPCITVPKSTCSCLDKDHGNNLGYYHDDPMGWTCRVCEGFVEITRVKVDSQPPPPTHHPTPSAKPPSWGGVVPAARPLAEAAGENFDEFVDTIAAQLRFFTIVTADGSVLPNNGTSNGETVEEAEASIRQTWETLCAGQSGKQIVEVTYQPDGRVGEDHPVKPAAPPNLDREGCATQFRWHHGNLEASMKTAVPCASMSELVSILKSLDGFADLTTDMVEVKQYGYDERIDWDTYLVCVKGHAVGMTDGEL